MSKAKQDRTAVRSTNHYSSRAHWLRSVVAAGQMPLIMWLHPESPHIAVIGRRYDHKRDSAAWSYKQTNRDRLVAFLTRLRLVVLDRAGASYDVSGMVRRMQEARHV